MPVSGRVGTTRTWVVLQGERTTATPGALSPASGVTSRQGSAIEMAF